MRKLFSMIVSVALGFGVVTMTYASTNNDIDAMAKLNQPVVQGKLVLHKDVLNALVEPYLEEVVNHDSNRERMLVWIIADDGKTYKVFYNQETHKFGMAKYTSDGETFTSDSLNVQNELSKVFLAKH